MEDDIELIDRYMEDLLSIEEKEAFEDRLKADENFKETVKHYMIGVEAVIQETDKDIKSDLRGFLDNTQTKSTQWGLYKYAAVVTLVICGFLVFKLLERGNDPLTDEPEHYMEPFPGAWLKRSVTPINEAIVKYNDKEYIEALPRLLTAAKSELSPSTFHLMVGNCYLFTEQYDTALEWFGKMSDAKNTLDIEHGQWFSAIAKYKSGQVDAARLDIKDLAKNSQYYKEYAAQFLEVLEK